MSDLSLEQRINDLEFQVEQLVKYNQALIRLLEDRWVIDRYKESGYINQAQAIKELDAAIF